jgi:hypothetical protein
MIIFLFIFIILIFIYLLLDLFNIIENFNIGNNNKQMIPFNNPFKTDFYIDNKHKQKDIIGLRPNSFGELFINRYFSQQMDKKKYNIELDIIKDINEYKINFGIISLEAYSYFELNTKVNNIEFIATLVNANVHILAHNDINIEFTYEGTYNRIYKINVIEENSLHHLSCKKLLNYLNISKYFEFVYIPIVNSQKIDIIYYIGINPISYLIEIQKKQNLHYININFKGREQDFIEQYKSYKLSLVDINNLIQFYPHLTIIDKRSNYINTISTQYILISNNKSPFVYIKDLFIAKKNILNIYGPNNLHSFKDLTIVEMNYNVFNIPYNIEAQKFYKSLNLHSNEDNIYKRFYRCYYYYYEL